MSTELSTVEALRAEVAPVVQQAAALVIRTPDDYAAAGAFVIACNKAIAKAKGIFRDPQKGIVTTSYRAYQATLDLEKSIIGPLQVAKDTGTDKQLEWDAAREAERQAQEARLQAIENERKRKEREKAEQEAARQLAIEEEQRRKADELRRKIAEAERVQREKEAAAQREADEARRKAAAEQDAAKRLIMQREAEKREAEAAKKAGAEAAERARLQREAEAAERKAAAAAVKVEEKQEQAAAAIPTQIHVESVAPKVAGQRTSTTIKARITDPKAAATALLAFPDWSAYLSINQGEIDKFGKRTNGNTPIPGIEWYTHTTMASASK